MGTTVSYASFNDRSKPIIKNTVAVCASNSVVGFTAGFAVFSVIGYLITIGSPVSDRVQSIGLAFVSYPAAVD
jgi:SNF family Na+-dependent transporter